MAPLCVEYCGLCCRHILAHNSREHEHFITVAEVAIGTPRGNCETFFPVRFSIYSYGSARKLTASFTISRKSFYTCGVSRRTHTVHTGIVFLTSAIIFRREKGNPKSPVLKIDEILYSWMQFVLNSFLNIELISGKCRQKSERCSSNYKKNSLLLSVTWRRVIKNENIRSRLIHIS